MLIGSLSKEILLDETYYEQTRQEMLRFIPEQRDRVLEVGCGAATFIGALPNVRERWGVEPSEAALFARGRVHHLLHGYFFDVADKLPQRYFDLIICNDVIEHMPDHWRFLSEVKKYLAPGGCLVGSIPNVRFYNNLFELILEKDWHYTDSGILDRTHLAFFTKKSLNRTLRQAGFQIMQFEGINRDFLPSARSRHYLTAVKVLSALAFGNFDDTRYMQFAFRAVPGTGTP